MTTENETSTESTVNDSTFEGLAELGTIIAAAKDAMTDDMVSRLAGAFSEGITLLDRLTRNEGLVHLLQELDRPENQQFLISLSNAFTAASKDIATAPPAKGGVMDLYKLASNPGTQEGLRLVSMIGEHLSEGMRDIHRRGG